MECLATPLGEGLAAVPVDEVDTLTVTFSTLFTEPNVHTHEACDNFWGYGAAS